MGPREAEPDCVPRRPSVCDALIGRRRRPMTHSLSLSFRVGLFAFAARFSFVCGAA